VEEGQAFPVSLQSELAVHINSFVVSLEAVFLIVFVTKHFRIKTGQEDHFGDEDCYDELHGSFVSGIDVGRGATRDANCAKKS